MLTNVTSFKKVLESIISKTLAINIYLKICGSGENPFFFFYNGAYNLLISECACLVAHDVCSSK